MATEYKDATRDVAHLIAELIPAHHPDLVGARIEFVFVDPTPKSKGRRVLGRARKIGGLNAWLARRGEEPEPFFVIEIAEIPWHAMEEAERVALLDHELCHLVVDEDGRLGTVGHDIEEFTAVVARRGAWHDELERFLISWRGRLHAVSDETPDLSGGNPG